VGGGGGGGGRHVAHMGHMRNLLEISVERSKQNIAREEQRGKVIYKIISGGGRRQLVMGFCTHSSESLDSINDGGTY